MWGGGGGTGGSGGGGGLDPSALAGYASMVWVEDNYVSKSFFNQMFEVKVHVVETDTTADPQEVITDTTRVLAPNEVIVATSSATDPETGHTIVTTMALAGIQAKTGLWTNSYLSALGQNSGGGGGGGTMLFEPLLSINESGLAAPTDAQDGMTVVWDKNTHKWKYGATGGGSGDYLPLTGGTLTGNLSIKGAHDLSLANNGITDSNRRYYGYYIKDANNKRSAQYINTVSPDGNNAFWMSVTYGFDQTTGIELDKGFGLTVDKQGNCTWNVSDPAAFRTAIGVNFDNFVTINTDQTITGKKTFTKNIVLTNSHAIIMKNTQDVECDVLSYNSSNNLVLGWGVRNTSENYICGKTIQMAVYDATDINTVHSVFYANNAGNVAIGTVSPYTKLDVDGGVKATKFYLYKPNANNDTGAVYFQYVSGQSGVQLVGAGLFTESYISALGANSAGGGGATLFEPLLSINESGLAAPTDAQDGMTVVWDKNTHKWKYGATGGGSGEYLPLTIPNAGSTVNMPGIGKLTFKNTASDYPIIRFEGNTGGGLGFLGIGKTGDDISPYFVTAVNGNYVEGHSQWYKLWHDGSHPTTIQGYGITDAVKNNATWWGQSITNGVVSGNMTGVGGISMTGNISMTGTYDLTLSNNGVTSIAYPGYRLFDANGNIASQYIGIVNPNGKSGFWISARNYDTNGTMIADRGLGIDIDKNGAGIWKVDEPASFRTAIGINLDNLVTTNTDQTIIGTKTFTSNIILANNRELRIKDTGGTACNVVSLNSNNNFVLGWGVRNVSDTYLCGKTLSLYVHDSNNINTTRNVLYADNVGNVGIGTNSPAAKLDVNGHLKAKTFLACHNGVGTIGTAGWVCLANIKVNSTYVSQPLKFRVTQRGRFGGEITLRFTNVSAVADANIQEFSYTGNIVAAKIVKSGANFSLYVQKSEAYDNIGISLVDLGSYMADRVTVTWSDTLLTTDPGGTAAACRYYFSSTAYLEYDATNGAIHVVGAGLYSDSYVSALGANSSGGGGGGGASTLNDLLDVTVSNPSGGQVLTYSNGQWINAAIPTPSMTGYATETWVENNFASLTWIGQQGYLTSSSLNGYATQTWVNQQGFITSSSISDMATKTWVQNQGYLTSSSLSGYATQSWVQNQGYLTSSAISDMATKTWVQNQNYLTGITSSQVTTALGFTPLSNATTFWGQSVSSGVVKGSIYAGIGGGIIDGFHSIELNSNGTLSGYGGFIDFHFNGSSSDYTSRIIEDANGRLFMDADNGVRIGNAVLKWDSTNNALYVQRSDGSAVNLYATGGVSALGFSAGISSVEAMTFGYLTVNTRLNLPTTIVAGNSPMIARTASDSDCVYMLYNSAYSKVTGYTYYYNQYDNVGLRGTDYNYDDQWWIDPDGCARFRRLYLDATRYLYVSSGTLYYYNGTTSKQIAFIN